MSAAAPLVHIDLPTLSAALIPVALEAGRIQLRHHGAGVAVVTKSDASPVTCADQESEALILAALARIAPDIPVVAEEEAAAGRLPCIGRQFFLVDPLDGTREFIAGRAEFTINIALIEDGIPVFGLVYAPATGDFFLTPDKGRAAYTCVPPSGRVPQGLTQVGTASVLKASTLTASTLTASALPSRAFKSICVRAANATALVAVASRSHMNAETEAFLARYAIASRQQAGSSLKFCLLAKGEADVYPRLGRTCEWDTAAGHAILAAAGGQVVKLDGTQLH